MLYVNQIIKICFWPYQTISEVVHGGGLEVVSKNILIPIRKNPMVNSVNYRKYAKYPVFRDDVTFFFCKKQIQTV
jgi:hypothetical protein